MNRNEYKDYDEIERQQMVSFCEAVAWRFMLQVPFRNYALAAPPLTYFLYMFILKAVCKCLRRGSECERQEASLLLVNRLAVQWGRSGCVKLSRVISSRLYKSEQHAIGHCGKPRI